MSEITLEKTYALLEKLADYVMTEVPALKQDLEQKADKADVRLLLEGMDAQARQLDELRTELKSGSGTLDNHEGRLAGLEEHSFGARIRDEKENYQKNHTTGKQE